MRVRTGMTTLALTALAGAVIASGAEASGGRVREVTIRDRCDPVTFAEVPGGCTDHPGGETTFDELVEELLSTGAAEGWRFNPDETTIRTSERIRSVNRGGEFHTFTKVPFFGPGCVDDINFLMGFGPEDPRPFVCTPSSFEAEIIPQGQRSPAVSLPRGKHLFMCLIHPWMQTEVTVRRS